MKKYFLFQLRPEASWPKKRKWTFRAWNVLFLLFAAAGLTLVTMFLAVGPYSLGLCRGYLECPLILLLNFLPVVSILLLFYGLTGRPGASFLATCIPVLGFAFGNYYKLMFRDDPVMFADLFILKEVGDMAGKYQLFLDWKLILSLLCVLFGWLFLHFFVRGRPRRAGRIIWTVLGLAALLGSIHLCRDDTIYNTKAAYYDRLNNRWAATQQYIARGGLYPFFHSINSAFETPPADYDKEQTAALLAQYEDADIPEDEKVNIVSIMLEAYADFSQFDSIPMAQDVYQVWHDLEAEGYSGNLLTNIFAGGTVNTERCFLTGYSTLNNFRQSTNSYVWYFRSQGYFTEGMHPCYQWFYNRLNINEYLGFEDYWFSENYFAELTGGIAGDDVFFPELLAAYQAATADGTPYFNFSLTYQGHGPYESTYCRWGELGDYVADGADLTESSRYILENYLGSIANTNQNLKELTDYFRQDEEPVILILFGDHMPWLGDGNSVYNELGITFDLSTQEGFYDYYSTRYLIWANDAAKEILGCDFQGEGPDLGPYFLMSELFDLCGWEGSAYMQAIDAVSEQVPVIHNSGRYLEDGVLTSTLSDTGNALVQEYRSLQYYWRNNFSK